MKPREEKPEENSKIYKYKRNNNISSLRTVSMIPGNREVAGCFNFSNNFGVLYTYFDRKRKSRFSTSNQLLKVVSRWVKLAEQDFDNAPLNQKNKCHCTLKGAV